jgi:hypothetical protein
MAERRYYNDIAKDQIHGKEDIKTGTGAAATAFVEGGSNAVSASFFYGDGSQLTGVGDAGISWDGSTSNGVATYKNASEATVEANLTFDGSTLNVAGDVEADGLTVDSAGVITLETSNTGPTAITLNSANMFFLGGNENNAYQFHSKPLYLATIADPTPTLGKLWHQPLGTLNWAYSLEVGGTIITNASIKIEEAAAAGADTAAYGQLWVKTATPNELYFTTDAGDDIQLTSGARQHGGRKTIVEVDASLNLSSVATALPYSGAVFSVEMNGVTAIEITLPTATTAAEATAIIGWHASVIINTAAAANVTVVRGDTSAGPDFISGIVLSSASTATGMTISSNVITFVGPQTDAGNRVDIICVGADTDHTFYTAQGFCGQ